MANALPSPQKIELAELRTLRSLLAALKRPPNGQPIGKADDPPWMERDQVVECYESTYQMHLQHFPVRYRQGHTFVTGDGSGPLRLFWKLRRKYFARVLNEQETARFCQLSQRSRR